MKHLPTTISGLAFPGLLVALEPALLVPFGLFALAIVFPLVIAATVGDK